MGYGVNPTVCDVYVIWKVKSYQGKSCQKKKWLVFMMDLKYNNILILNTWQVLSNSLSIFKDRDITW